MAKPALPPVPEQGFDQAKLYLWVKGLEGKVNTLLREVDILKNDFIRRSNDLKKEVKTLNEDLTETRHELSQTVQKMDLIIKELGRTAGIEEVETLKKYLEYWNPLNFVTQRDIDRIIETKMAQLPALVPAPVHKNEVRKEAERSTVKKEKHK
ncbi:hypothetical protein J4228_04225 [Candidatus Woesearchaeota archaeon]|nr:hypothetical protein [Candidatus Woesearchaeota archaeon]